MTDPLLPLTLSAGAVAVLIVATVSLVRPGGPGRAGVAGGAFFSATDDGLPGCRRDRRA